MAIKASGIIVIFDEAQRNEILTERVEDNEPFSDALSVRDWPIGKLCVALLSFEKGIFSYLALARKGRRVATAKDQVEFSSPVQLDRLPIDSVQRHISSNLVRYFVRSSTGTGGTIPPGTWKEILSSVLTERPSIEKDLARLLSLTKYSGIAIRGPSADLLLQEREALGISLDIFSGGAALRKKVLGEWAPNEASIVGVDEDSGVAMMAKPSQRTPSFLDGIPGRYFQEESAIQHDLFNWDGNPADHMSGVSVFVQGKRRLEVVYANRNSIEKTLGVDLVYFNELYNSFVLVQYKLMTEQGGEFIYRPDPQLIEEMNRMDQFYVGYADDGQFSDEQEYRICDDPFLLKLVPNKGLSPASGELIKGMYLPRVYARFLLGPDGPKGPKGGSLISFENSRRYLSNSEFSLNVNAGRIGSRGAKTAAIRALIRAYYETGRAILVAREDAQENPEVVG